ncbi:DNA mismatch repair endonuclease MutL [candidate division WWE3 bacterium]|jgi:DNA mismatch repair protein MutL|uniref:DNA mismatch repair protein MutL n=1 Tax=candidate division WWE3 bacterium TaxID=2053526 RepID=A0A3A4ZJT1_UNCKA|nr:MAG: DNA mismatch repair endonuclease MutL [candidate division WWE3 bacterium]
MSEIRSLPQDVVDRIAAGEVIERPASVIKELLENAIDAHSSKIAIEVEDVGLGLIRIADDGDGMSKEDLLKCYLSHHTSKIKSDEDLHTIKSLGFRGEALGSIASISTLVIKSRKHTAEFGSEIVIQGGILESEKPVGINPGTIVEVRNLFFNVPVRKRFLNSPQTELKHIMEVFIDYAFAFRTIEFKFSRRGSTQIFLKKSDTLPVRLNALLGMNVAENMYYFETSEGNTSIKGYISKPQFCRYSRDTQFLYVNNRPVTVASVAKAVKTAYGNLIDTKAFPSYVIFVETEPNMVDVNIHPRKKEIRFWNESGILQLLQKVVNETLLSNDNTYVIDYVYDKKALKTPFLKLKDTVDTWNIKGLSEEDISGESIQVGDTYILFPSREGLILIDQHAAHESILYEQYLKAFLDITKEKKTYPLRTPVIVDIPLSKQALMYETVKVFENLGFDITEFGSGSWKVTAVPEIFNSHDIVSLILELMEDIAAVGKISDIDKRSEKTVSYLACRGAIKAGERLTSEERKNILDKLEEKNYIYTCPHGRPVKAVITIQELERLFKRRK